MDYKFIHKKTLQTHNFRTVCMHQMVRNAIHLIESEHLLNRIYIHKSMYKNSQAHNIIIGCMHLSARNVHNTTLCTISFQARNVTRGLRHSAEKPFSKNTIKPTIILIKIKILTITLAITRTPNLTLALTLSLFTANYLFCAMVCSQLQVQLVSLLIQYYTAEISSQQIRSILLPLWEGAAINLFSVNLLFFSSF